MKKIVLVAVSAALGFACASAVEIVSKTIRPRSDEWVPMPYHWTMTCCDCGLVHEVEIRVVDGEAWMRWTRDDAATNRVRKFNRRLAWKVQ